MSLPDQTPQLPKLPFLIGDAALLILAGLIVHRSGSPLSSEAIVGATVCVALGAVLGAVPFLTEYARKQDESLDERQRGLEALSRTINTAAEQISIAANGLHEITEIAHKNVKHAEQLPHKLQEKVAELKAQLDSTRDDEREELEKEIAELRASETERLQSVADKIHKAVADLTKLDAAAQKQIAARTDLLERASSTVAKVNADASVALTESAASAARELTAAQAKALDAVDVRLAERTAAALAAIDAALARATAAAAAVASAPALEPLPAPAPATVTTEAPTSDIASPPKRPRKSRREEPAPAEPAAAEPAAPESVAAEAEAATPSIETTATPGNAAEEATPAPTALPEPVVIPPSASVSPEPLPVVPPLTFDVPSETPLAAVPAASTPAALEPPPLAPVSFSEKAPAPPVVEASPTPVAAPPAEPAPEVFLVPPSSLSSPIPTPVDEATVAPLPAPEPVDRPVRKRVPRKPVDPIAELALDLPIDDSPAGPADDDTPAGSEDDAERVLSSDGATRLIATAYIGIGNRLFIRGDGPGLSWEKGVPLQFISIGKWRWETADADTPISFKLYKNDDVECTALGALTLAPGYQQEVTAKF